MIWGFVPVYYKLLVHVPPIELLAHRTFWSFLFFFAILFFNRKVKDLRDAVFVSKESRLTIVMSASLIAINWFFFIFAVQSNNITETSLGYFIMPLVTVVWGLILFKEKLSYAQWTAVLLATIAVLILTIGLTKAPWIALILAFSFSYYAVLKKKLQIAPMVSVTGEVFILIPAAIVIIIYFHQGQGGHLERTSTLRFYWPYQAHSRPLRSFYLPMGRFVSRCRRQEFCSISTQVYNFFVRLFCF